MWSELGHAYLAASQVPDAIAAYLRSSDSSRYVQVIDACTAVGCYEDLVKFLLMVRGDDAISIHSAQFIRFLCDMLRCMLLLFTQRG